MSFRCLTGLEAVGGELGEAVPVVRTSKGATAGSEARPTTALLILFFGVVTQLTANKRHQDARLANFLDGDGQDVL